MNSKSPEVPSAQSREISLLQQARFINLLQHLPSMVEDHLKGTSLTQCELVTNPKTGLIKLEVRQLMHPPRVDFIAFSVVVDLGLYQLYKRQPTGYPVGAGETQVKPATRLQIQENRVLDDVINSITEYCQAQGWTPHAPVGVFNLPQTSLDEIETECLVPVKQVLEFRVEPAEPHA